jgi:hypothetical protein
VARGEGCQFCVGVHHIFERQRRDGGCAKTVVDNAIQLVLQDSPVLGRLQRDEPGILAAVSEPATPCGAHHRAPARGHSPDQWATLHELSEELPDAASDSQFEAGLSALLRGFKGQEPKRLSITRWSTAP